MPRLLLRCKFDFETFFLLRRLKCRHLTEHVSFSIFITTKAMLFTICSYEVMGKISN
jgi:uncharacterized protein YcsI (UPF0317 family)